jgi:hypothetical protein
VSQHGVDEQSCWPLVEGRANAFTVRSARAMLPARGAVCRLLCVCFVSVSLTGITWLVCVIQLQRVFCEPRTEFLHIVKTDRLSMSH